MVTNYSKEHFKAELNKMLEKEGYDPAKVAKFASAIFFQHQSEIDLKLREKLLDLMTMEDGSEFELTENEFKEFLTRI